jgi:hypothetical protein
MDPERFDHLVVNHFAGPFGAPRTRRTALGSFGAAIIAWLGGQLVAPLSTSAIRRGRSGRRQKVHADALLALGRKCNKRKPQSCASGACAKVDFDKGEAFTCLSRSKRGKTVCCEPSGGPCSNSCQCCGAVLCNKAGLCGPACAELGDHCETATECCSGGLACATVAADKGEAVSCTTPSSGTVCCIPEGAGCTSHCQCCGTLRCVRGFCVDHCLDLNAACHKGSDVCCDRDRSVECAIVEPQKGRTRCDTTVAAYVAQCCVVEGNLCSNDCQCCGSLRCQNGVCAPPPNVCHALGESCVDGEPCCAGAGACTGGRCCLGDGAACSQYCGAEADCVACCAGYCRGDGRCGPPQGCVEYGGSCTTSAECCDDVPCTLGRCRYD